MSGKMLRCRRWGQKPSATGAVGGGTWPATEGKSLDFKGGKAHDYKGKGKGYEFKGKGFDIKGKRQVREGRRHKGKGRSCQGVCWNCGKVGHKANECASQRLAYAVEEEIVEEADVGGVWSGMLRWRP